MQSLGNTGNLQSGEAGDFSEIAVFTRFSAPVHAPHTASAVWEADTLTDMCILHSARVHSEGTFTCVHMLIHTCAQTKRIDWSCID